MSIRDTAAKKYRLIELVHRNFQSFHGELILIPLRDAALDFGGLQVIEYHNIEHQAQSPTRRKFPGSSPTISDR